MEYNKKGNGILYIIPTPLVGYTSVASTSLLTNVLEILEALDIFIVETERTSRRLIRKILPHRQIDDILFYPLKKNRKENDYKALLAPCLKGKSIGMMSDLGCPAIADPGALLVKEAYQQGIVVRPLEGSSSIQLALMGSGLSGQNFAFWGYLPIKEELFNRELQNLYRLSEQYEQTQIFMETPFRNNKTLERILKVLPSECSLCIASNLTFDNQLIINKKVAQWKGATIDLHKKPTIFIFNAYPPKS